MRLTDAVQEMKNGYNQIKQGRRSMRRAMVQNKGLCLFVILGFLSGVFVFDIIIAIYRAVEDVYFATAGLISADDALGMLEEEE